MRNLPARGTQLILPKQVDFFSDKQKTVAVAEERECFGSRGKTHVSTFLRAV